MLYYLDWVAGYTSLVGMYLVGKKIWWGWIVNALNLIILTFISAYFNLWGFIPVNIVLMTIYIKNMLQWYREKKNGC